MERITPAAAWMVLVLAAASPCDAADCPNWLKHGAPFDVEAFLAAPAEVENAAPLYLEAFAEFSPRGRRISALSGKLDASPEAVDREAVDALLIELEEGFRKLEAAQRRARCAFPVDWRPDGIAAHARAAREVVRAIWIRVFRDVEAGRFDRPIRDLAVGFRLDRDLRPQGSLVTQAASIANDGVLCNSTLPTLLAAPSLRVEDCDRLTAVLRENATAGVDRFGAALKAEYVRQRMVIHAFENEGGENGRRMKRELTLSWISRYAADAIIRDRDGSETAPVLTVEKIDALFAGHPASWEAERDVVAEFYKTLAASEANTHAERVRRFEALARAHLAGAGAEAFWIGRLLIPDYRFLIESTTRGDLYVGAAECRVAGRRWRLTHATVDPTNLDLARACEEAGLSGVPNDPFSGSPLRFAVVDGRPLVDSIGPDGVDDRGLKDSRMGRDPKGDLLFPMAPSPAR